MNNVVIKEEEEEKKQPIKDVRSKKKYPSLALIDDSSQSEDIHD